MSSSPNTAQNLSLQSVDTDNKKQKLLDVHNKNEIGKENENPTKYRRRTICWFICGLFLIILSIQLTFIPHLINNSIHKAIVDAFIFTKPMPDNSHYKTWVTNDGGVPIMFSIQFFNITNPDGVLRGEIPKLNLTGPIVYNQYYYRQNINFSNDGQYVNQTFFTTYLYNDELSEIDPNERLTVLSPLVSTVYHEYSVSGKIKKEEMIELMKIFEDDPNLLFWRNKKATDLIWSIYHFNFLNFHFEWGFMRNESNQYYILHTGSNDHKRMGEVERWCRSPLTMDCLYNKSNEYISVWNPAMKISPGHLFYEGVYALNNLNNKNDLPPLWIDILFRNVYLEYNNTYNYKGIKLWKYGIQLDPQLSNISEYPPNKQYNQYGPSGILNSSAAYDNIQMYLSMVLFYGATDYLKNNTKLGIPQPGPYDYPYIDIEPRTGAVFYANASMQLCTPIHSLPNINKINITSNKPNLFNLSNDMMIPMYLVTFSDAVTSSISNNFKNNMALGDTLHEISIVIGWVAVAFLLIWSFVTVFVAGVYYHGYKIRNVR